jgi:monofunctional biosynthetic peptidoglycan transglycosylase
MTMSSIATLASSNPHRTSFMRYRAEQTGRPAGDLAWTPIDAISPLLLCALVKAEDPRFFVHHGIDFEETLVGIIRSWRARKPVGNVSSITQQVARNLFLTPGRTLRRKATETLIALRLEWALPKLRILEIYANSCEWGDEVWGCTAAAAHYFQKPPAALDAFESIFLAGLLPAPRAPLRGDNLQRAWVAQMQTLHLLYLSEFIGIARFTETLKRARLVYRLLREGHDLRSALAAPPQPDVVAPTLPVHVRDDECVCTLEAIASTQCALRKDFERRLLLIRRFTYRKVMEAMTTNDYSIFRDHDAGRVPPCA